MKATQAFPAKICKGRPGYEANNYLASEIALHFLLTHSRTDLQRSDLGSYLLDCYINTYLQTRPSPYTSGKAKKAQI